MPDDRTYFEGRAEAELKAAEASDHPDAVKAHYLLAGYYLDLVYGNGGPAAPSPPTATDNPLRLVASGDEA